MSWKDDYINRHGEAAYEKELARVRAWDKAHRKEERAKSRAWRDTNPEKVEEYHHKKNRKGGCFYEKYLEHQHTGLRGRRNRVRAKHGREYRQYKRIIAPSSQIHHEWIPETSDYRGVALVETDRHMRGFIDVIEILDGKITLLTEEEIRRGNE